MKHFFIPFKLLFVFFLFTACTKKEEKPTCTGEQVYEALYVTEYNELIGHTGAVNGDVQRFAGYVEGNAGTFSQYYTELRLNHICNTDYPLIAFELWLKTADTLAVQSAYLQEVGNPNQTVVPIQTLPSDYFYGGGLSYQFQTTSGFTPGVLYLHFEFAFPYQGSPTADSAYFFSNLNQLKTEITTTDPWNY
jgi:hypothetical protein